MSSNTTNLNLLKKNTTTDGNDTFNIDTMLNDNWDKIDTAVGQHTTTLGQKVDKVTGKQLSTEDYTTAEKNKLAGVSTGANKTESSVNNGNVKVDGVEKTVYTHPANHPASMITEDATHRFTNDTDKTKLGGISTGATKAESSTTNGNIKIDGVEKTVYTHPSNHPATMITEDSTHRFATDAEKNTWNGKQNALGFTPENTSNKGVASGYASLDVNGLVPDAQIPSGIARDTELSAHTSRTDNPHGTTASQIGAIPSSEKGATSGVATLGTDGKIPSAQLPSMDYIPNSSKGVANGVATLDVNTLILLSNIPTVLTGKDADTVDGKHASDLVLATSLGVANGVATLGADSKIPSGQLPSMKDQRGATLVVASSTSSASGKAGADYVCDGVDDQVEINNALTALGGVGGKVVLLEGTFNTSNSINMRSNCLLEGQGDATVLKMPNANNTSMNVIQNEDQTNGNTGITVCNLKIDGNKANQTVGNPYGFFFKLVTYSTIQNVNVSNMRGYAIHLYTGSNYNRLIGNMCQNSSNGISFYASNNNTATGNIVQGNSSYGIYVSSTSNNNTVTGNIVQGNSSYGIYVSSSNNNTVAGNIVQGNSLFGMYISSSNNNTITGNTVQGNSNSGINLTSSSNNIITGNMYQGNNNNGINLTSSSNYNTVTGNTCQGNNKNGINLDSSSNNTITGNTCLENSQTTNVASDNIFLTTNSNTNNIQSNTCRQGALTNKPRYGIRVDTSTCTGNLITNNDLTTGGATGAFSDVGTGTITTAGNKTA